MPIRNGSWEAPSDCVDLLCLVRDFPAPLVPSASHTYAQLSVTYGNPKVLPTSRVCANPGLTERLDPAAGIARAKHHYTRGALLLPCGSQ